GQRQPHDVSPLRKSVESAFSVDVDHSPVPGSATALTLSNESCSFGRAGHAKNNISVKGNIKDDVRKYLTIARPDSVLLIARNQHSATKVAAIVAAQLRLR